MLKYRILSSFSFAPLKISCFVLRSSEVIFIKLMACSHTRIRIRTRIRWGFPMATVVLCINFILHRFGLGSGLRSPFRMATVTIFGVDFRTRSGSLVNVSYPESHSTKTFTGE